MDFFGKYRYRNYYRNNSSFVEPLVVTNTPLYTTTPLEQSNTVFRRQHSIQQPTAGIDFDLERYTPSSYGAPTTPFKSCPRQIMLCDGLRPSGVKSFGERSCSVGYSGTPGVHWIPQAESIWSPSALVHQKQSKKRVSFSNGLMVRLIPTRNEYDNKPELWWTTAEIVNMRSNKVPDEMKVPDESSR
jgi:hypothetical protein